MPKYSWGIFGAKVKFWAKLIKNISYVFSLLCPIMPSMIMPNYAPTKPHLGPKFCPSYIPEDYQVAIIHIFEESKSISFRKILVTLGNFGELWEGT